MVMVCSHHAGTDSGCFFVTFSASKFLFQKYFNPPDPIGLQVSAPASYYINGIKNPKKMAEHEWITGVIQPYIYNYIGALTKVL